MITSLTHYKHDNGYKTSCVCYKISYLIINNVSSAPEIESCFDLLAWIVLSLARTINLILFQFKIRMRKTGQWKNWNTEALCYGEYSFHIKC